MDNLYLHNLAKTDVYLHPVIFLSFTTWLFIYSTPHNSENWTNYFFGSKQLISLGICALFVLSVLNTFYSLQRKYFNIYLKLRIFFHTVAAVLMLKLIEDSEGYTKWTTAQYIGVIIFIQMDSLWIHTIVEKVEVVKYKDIQENHMDKVYKRKFTLLGVPVDFFLYVAVFFQLRHLFNLFAVFVSFRELDFRQSTSLFGILFICTLCLIGTTGTAHALNSLTLLVGIKKKSSSIVLSYYHIKTLIMLILRCSWILAAVMNAQLIKTGLGENENKKLSISHNTVWPLLELLEAALTLRYYSYLILEKELQVGTFSFELGNMEGNPQDFFNTRFEIDVTRFLKSIRIPWRKMTLGELVGEGQFSKVYKGSMSQLCKTKNVAVKVIKSQTPLPSILSELKIHSLVSKHPNLVGFLGICKVPCESDQHYLGIVSEFVERGSLQSCLLDLQQEHRVLKNGFDSASLEITFIKWAIEIAQGMEFLSSKRIVHGDLAARNILVTSDFKCKISDFGMSIRLYQYQIYATSAQTLLPFRWMAPESICDFKFSTKSDVWTYGVLFWEIYSLGKLPWGICEWGGDLLSRIRGNERLPKPLLTTPQIYSEVMMNCWQFDENFRLDFKDILQLLRNYEENGYSHVQISGSVDSSL